MDELRRLLDTYEEMLATALTVGDREKAALCQNYVGATLRLMGRWEESYQCHLKSLEFARSLSVQLPLSIALSNIGALCAEMARYDEAMEYIDESLGIASELGNPLRIASARGTIGKVLLARGRWAEAIDQFKACLDLTNGKNSLRHVMCSYTSLGITECARGDFPAAEGYLSRAEQVAARIREELTLAGVSITRTLSDGSFSLEEDLKRRRDLFALDLAFAQLERLRGKRKDFALEKANAALATARAIGYKYGEIRALLEVCWISRGNRDNTAAITQAEAAIKKAQELGARQLEAEGFHVLAVLKSFPSTSMDRTADYFSKSTSLFESVGDIQGAGRAYLDYGVFLLHRRSEREASLMILRGLQRLVSLQKTSESYETGEWLGKALGRGANYLEERLSESLEQISVLEDELLVASREQDASRFLSRALALQRDVSYLFSASRVMSQCASLALRLVPKDHELIHAIRSQARNLNDIVGIARDQEHMIDNHISAADRILQESAQRQEKERDVILKLLQTSISSLVVTSIYTAFILRSVTKVAWQDLLAVALTAITWALVPRLLYNARLRVGTVASRLVLGCVVLLGIIASCVHLIWRIAP